MKTIPIRGLAFAPGDQSLNEPTNDLDMETLDLLQEMLRNHVSKLTDKVPIPAFWHRRKS